MTGYSKTPLLKKLGIKEHMLVSVIDAPQHFMKLLGPLPADVTVVQQLKNDVDVIHFFVKKKSALSKAIPALVKSLRTDGMLWISWPKGTSRIESDLSRDEIREMFLSSSPLVDIKICAIDEDWSGLKFMYRKKERK